MSHDAKPELQNRIVAIIGRKGTGKSTKLTEILTAQDRVLVFDPMAEHDWSPNEIDSLDKAATGGSGFDSLREFFKWNHKKKQWAANYVPGEKIEDEVEAVSRIVYQHGNCAFGLDEVGLFCSPGHLPEALGKLVRTGRHKKIDIYWTGLRAGEISRTLTSLTDEFIIFSQTEPRDLDAIATRCGVEIADLVRRLEIHDFIQWDVYRGLTRSSLAQSEIESEPDERKLRIVS